MGSNRFCENKLGRIESVHRGGSQTSLISDSMIAFDTILPADSVEFCPHPTAQDILVCGTYKLIDTPGQTQQRTGECIVLQLDASDSAADRTL